MVELVSSGGVTVLAREDAVQGMLDIGFRLVEHETHDEDPSCDDQGENFEDMSKQGLIDFAREHGVAVNPRDNKSTILAAIRGSI